MAGVGGVACTYVHGEARPLRQRVETWQTPGINGYGSQLMGGGQSDFQFKAVLYDVLANVQAWSLAIGELQGQVVSIVDDWGVEHLNLLITEVGILKRSPAINVGINTRGEIDVTGVALT